ncbi:MAG TPA: hypothetical protein VLA36_13960 [Longimicrobiales bacterium]|nr:hypothetical protein [Longimicrobiales bacterium]
MNMLLSDIERRIVHEALDEIRATPSPVDRAPLGCAIALPGFAVLLVFPVVGRMLGLGSGVATLALILGGALVVVGVVLWFSAGGFVRGHALAAAEAALRALEADDEDREVLLRAATLLVVNGYATYGPTTSTAVDVDKARVRLGKHLGMVEAVERLLLEEGAAYPIFTKSDEEPPRV